MTTHMTSCHNMMKWELECKVQSLHTNWMSDRLSLLPCPICIKSYIEGRKLTRGMSIRGQGSLRALFNATLPGLLKLPVLDLVVYGYLFKGKENLSSKILALKFS